MAHDCKEVLQHGYPFLGRLAMIQATVASMCGGFGDGNLVVKGALADGRL